MGHPPYTTDTSDEAYQVQLELLRQMTPHERLRKSFALSRSVKQMAMDAIRRRFPDWEESDIRLKFIEMTYGRKLAEHVRQHQENRAIERTG